MSLHYDLKFKLELPKGSYVISKEKNLVGNLLNKDVYLNLD